MKVKLNKKVMLGNKIYQRGAVVESDDESVVNEMKALNKVGYSAETKEDVTADPHNKMLEPMIANKNVRQNIRQAGPNGNQPRDAFDPEAILDGTIPEVTERLSGLSVDQLDALDKAEAKGKARVGVHAAIEAAVAASE